MQIKRKSKNSSQKNINNRVKCKQLVKELSKRRKYIDTECKIEKQ